MLKRRQYRPNGGQVAAMNLEYHYITSIVRLKPILECKIIVKKFQKICNKKFRKTSVELKLFE